MSPPKLKEQLHSLQKKEDVENTDWADMFEEDEEF